jgi:lactate dehydrogenase-like 2-hydroxyacid dehydrogenase
MEPRILVSAPLPDEIVDRAVREFGAIVSQVRALTAAEIVEIARKRRLEGLLVTSRVKIDSNAINNLPNTVRILATYSVGYDHIDVAAAAARGIAVTNTPDVLNDATADLTMMLMLCASRRAAEYLAIMQAGWGIRHEPNEMLGVQLTHKKLGILGFGRIGQAVAKRARGFDMEILYHNPRPVAAADVFDATYFPDFHEMLRQTDILTLHAPGGPATNKIIDAAALAALPRGAVVVNAARGQLIDEDALIAALKSGHIAAAGLDVFRSEPHFDTRLRGIPNVFLTPHMGSATRETRNAMGHRALDNITAVLRGAPPADGVNKPA